ncbi:unnamed protein product [Mytilus coruscus]|uniref:WSC domain-containing protein n=1 Tax=Mytilus coruscus TaxID=42192 RepID=A0A6J8CKQ6_MYTCO|nr:unnamed protein product [Mytilus coruscus]
MDNKHIVIVFMFSIMNLKNADCALHFKCYGYANSYWDTVIQNNAVTNIWCENHCKAADIDYTFSGTISDICYCRKTQPPSDYVQPDNECTRNCPGASSEICGSFSANRITVSIIDRTPDTVTTTISQTTSLTSLAIGESPSTTCMDMLTTDTSPTKETSESFSTSSENPQYSISTVTSQTSTHTNTDVAFLTTDRMNQRKMLCECPKRLVNTKWHFLDEMDITDSEAIEIILQNFYQNVLPDIAVDKKAVTKEVRKRNSAVNRTKSAQFIGWGCIVFLVLPVVILVSIDLLNCWIYFQTRSRHNIRNRPS